MRLFVALNLPEPERARLHKAAAGLRRAAFPVRWAEPDALHLTLCFLGEVGEGRILAVEAVLGAVAAAHTRFPLELGGVGAFPDVRNPRVIWIGAAAAPALVTLQRDLERGLRSLDFEPDPRPFHPHITLGRARRWAGAKDFAEFTRVAASVEHRAVVPIGSVDLMRSHLTASAARYERIAAAPLEVSRQG